MISASMIGESRPFSMSFKEHPVLTGNMLGRSALGELWEFEHRQYLVDFQPDTEESGLGVWVLTDAEDAIGDQIFVLQSIRLCLENDISVELANFQTDLKHRSGWGEVRKVSYIGFLDSCSPKSNYYLVRQEGEGDFEVQVPKNPQAACRCNCEDYYAGFREALESGSDEECKDPYTCNHIDAIADAEIDKHSSTRRIYRAALFEPCEYWN